MTAYDQWKKNSLWAVLVARETPLAQDVLKSRKAAVTHLIHHAFNVEDDRWTVLVERNAELANRIFDVANIGAELVAISIGTEDWLEINATICGATLFKNHYCRVEGGGLCVFDRYGGDERFRYAFAELNLVKVADAAS
jgi:hypothetical protein